MPPVVDEDAILACAELIGRTRATEFEIGFQEDDETLWYAKAIYEGKDVEVRDRKGPTEAADALARRLLTGAKCKCGKLVTLSDYGATAYGEVTLADGTTWTAEEAAAAGQCRWTRVGAHWKRGCEE